MGNSPPKLDAHMPALTAAWIDHCAEPTKLTQKLAASHLDDYTYLRINLFHKMRKPDRGSDD
jgi:hypothetical protein